MAERGVRLVSMIWIPLQRQFNFPSCRAFENFVKMSLGIWDHNRKALHRLAYRHWLVRLLDIRVLFQLYIVSGRRNRGRCIGPAICIPQYCTLLKSERIWWIVPAKRDCFGTSCFPILLSQVHVIILRKRKQMISVWWQSDVSNILTQDPYPAPNQSTLHSHSIASNAINFVLCLCVRMEHLAFHWTDFHSIWYFGDFSKICQKNQVWWKSDKNNE